MNISSTSATSTTSSTTSSTSSTSSATGFDADSFLTLLIAELQNQDPLSPMDTQAMVSQLSTMEMVSESRTARQSQQMVEAIGLMGKTVTWQDSDSGNYYSAEVTGVYRDGSDPVLLLGDTQLKLEDIVAIS